MKSRHPLSATSVNHLVDLYGMEEQLYRLLFRLTEVQLEAVRSRAPVDRVVRLAEKKENILRSIERIDRCTRVAREQWLLSMNGSPSAERERLDSVLDGILKLIDGITINEQTSQELLSRRNGARLPVRLARRPSPHRSSAARIRAAVEVPI